MNHVAVIGGGASGLMAAVTAASFGAHVTIFERNERVGKKILATGNGRCNFTNLHLSTDGYHGSVGSVVCSYLERFDTDQTIDFFESNGLCWHDKNGYVYPYSDQASSVLDFFRMLIEHYQIKVLSGTMISRIDQTKDGRYQIKDGTGKMLSFDKVILATGGNASPGTGSDGNIYRMLNGWNIESIKPYPALTKLICSDPYCKQLSGVRANGRVTVHLTNNGSICEYTDQGEIQFTADGLSGIPVFQISRFVSEILFQNKTNSPVRVTLDLYPDITEEELYQMLLSKWGKYGDNICADMLLNGFFHKKINSVILKLCGQNAEAYMPKNKLKKIASLAKRFPFAVRDVYGFEQAQVSAGGIIAAELDANLQLVKKPGIYAIGEMVDIDGICGGYNLQWAWTSGYIAGLHASGSYDIAK